MDEEDNQLFYDMMKVYLAQMNSAVKISKILCEHSSKEEKELTGDQLAQRFKDSIQKTCSGHVIYI